MSDPRWSIYQTTVSYFRLTTAETQAPTWINASAIVAVQSRSCGSEILLDAGGGLTKLYVAESPDQVMEHFQKATKRP